MDRRIAIAVVLQAYDRLSSAVSKAAAASASSLTSLQRRANALADRSSSNGRQMIAAGLAVGAPIYKAMQAATEFETKMVDIRKQVKELDDPRQLAAMQTQIMALSKELPIPTQEIQELIAAGARMDIPRRELMNYTREVTKMSIAFDLSAGQIGEDMGKIAKVYDIPIARVGAFADAINYLDDNAISKGGQIIEVLQNIGGVSKFLRPEQAAALASTMLTLGESPERASSGINELIVTLSAASSQSAKAQAAFRSLGLDVAKVQTNMTVDAQGTILEVLDRINRLPKSKQTGVLNSMFGQEHIGKISKLAARINEYRRQLGLLNGQQKGSMTAEYQKRLASTAAQTQIFKNHARALAVTAGQSLLPALVQLMKAVAPLLTSFANWMQRNPRLTAGILKAAAGFSAMSLAGGYLSMVFGGVWKAVSVGAEVFGGLGRAIKFIGPVMNVVGKIFLGNPIIAIATAIALIVVLIISNWSKIRAFFARVWEAVKQAFNRFWQWLKKWAAYIHPVGIIYKHWDAIKAFFIGLWEKVKGIFKGVVAWVLGLGKQFWEAGKNIVKNILNGIMSMASKPVEAIKGIMKKIRDHLPFSPAKLGPLRDIHKIKLVETIAATIRPDSLVSAFSQTLGTFAAGRTRPAGAVAALPAGGGLHITVNLTLNGGATQQDAGIITGELKKTFKKLFNDYQQQQQRISFR